VFPLEATSICSLNVKPVHENECQRGGADDDPESQALEQRTETDALKSLLVQSCADKEESHREADFPQIIECTEGWSECR
jgi:hypothetical protein